MPKKNSILIIGGGPVGLTMALCLAEQGIASTLIEKHPGTSLHPKARGVNCRSMEIFRILGLEEAMAQYKMPREAHRFIWMEDLQGEEWTRIEASTDYSLISPTSSAVIAQSHVEHELFKKAQSSEEIDLRFNSQLINAEQNDDGIVAEILDKTTGQKSKLRSRYLIAADGAGSTVRELFGIDMKGIENLGEYCNIFCEMDIDKYLAERPSVGYMFTRPDIRSRFMLAMKGLRQWLVGVKVDTAKGWTKDYFTDERCIEFVKQLVNDESVEVKLINKGFWTMAALIAETYQLKRIFLIGDAAHRLPPTGGFGMNTGIQDAHNLAWKLAMVLKGQADESLLKTYQQERLPIAETNIAFSSNNDQRFKQIHAALAEKDMERFGRLLKEQSAHINNTHLDLGFVYGKEYAENNNFQQRAIVGGRAPHCWLEKEGQQLSTIDLFTNEYLLLCDPRASHWQQKIPASVSFPIRLVTVGEGGEYSNPAGDFLDIYQLDSEGAVLVRPDGHIAWHSSDGLYNQMAITTLSKDQHQVKIE